MERHIPPQKKLNNELDLYATSIKYNEKKKKNKKDDSVSAFSEISIKKVEKSNKIELIIAILLS
jgi:hypothetical protein